jgi:poly-gamma-glutamate capsule biosynthesis protein CapA/YwtB (metallophosphatase superfamily)
VKRGPLLLVLGLLAIAVALPITGGELGFGASTSSPAPSAAIAPGDGVASPSPSASNEGESGSTPAPSGSVGPAGSPAPTATPPAVIGDVPIVPVTQFRSTATSTSLAQVKAALSGAAGRYSALELVDSEADAVLAELHLDRPADPTRLILAKDAATLQKDLAKSRDRLGFLRADAVGPGVRALGWGARSLFGNARVEDLTAWPLRAQLPSPAAAKAFDAGSTWTLVAGGDIMLDRGVYQRLRVDKKGADYPFDGGTAKITSLVCCSSFGWKVPRTQRTGDAGAVRDLIKGADIAIANFENPAPDRFTWHTSGTIFSADQTLIDGLVDAGFDYVGAANNHIRDQGGPGLLQTLQNLRERGLKVSGSGKDLAAARKPAIFETHGVKVAILAYDAIAASYHATASKIGSAPMTAKVVTADVKAARNAGADVVIVFPHWGVEYRATPSASQQTLAHAIIDSGADMIIGNHAHWTAAMEVYKGKPIWYALGNLVFDQTWSAETMEGMTLELTFAGPKLAQVRIRPHIILDKAQPNFMDPAGSGKVVMDRVFKNSAKLAW